MFTDYLYCYVCKRFHFYLSDSIVHILNKPVTVNYQGKSLKTKDYEQYWLFKVVIRNAALMCSLFTPQLKVEFTSNILWKLRSMNHEKYTQNMSCRHPKFFPYRGFVIQKRTRFLYTFGERLIKNLSSIIIRTDNNMHIS